MLFRRDRSLPAPADEERHKQMKRVVGVRGEAEGREAGLLHTDAQLFAKLADERLFGPFAGFDLASRKLP